MVECEMYKSVEGEEKVYRKWKTSGRVEDKIRWKRARAIATRTFKPAKRTDMQQYLESMKVNTPTAKICEKMRKIGGRPSSRVNMLTSHTRLVATKRDIVNCLAEAFVKISDPANCSTDFRKIKEKEDGKTINFDSDNAEPHDDLFAMTELTTALNNSKDTAQALIKFTTVCSSIYQRKQENNCSDSSTDYEPPRTFLINGETQY